MKKIAVQQFAILAETLPTGDVTLNTRLSFMYSQESRQIACTTSFQFLCDNTLFLTLTNICEFKIQADDWNSLIKKNDLVIPRDLLELLAVHTIGTARGILFCKTEGTPFNSIMIPPINVSRMMEMEQTKINASDR